MLPSLPFWTSTEKIIKINKILVTDIYFALYHVLQIILLFYPNKRFYETAWKSFRKISLYWNFLWKFLMFFRQKIILTLRNILFFYNSCAKFISNYGRITRTNFFIFSVVTTTNCQSFSKPFYIPSKISTGSPEISVPSPKFQH